MTKLAKATGRSVEEWSSDDPSAMPPPRVRLRILRRYHNKCALTGILIADGQAFDLDHIVRIEDVGSSILSAPTKPFLKFHLKQNRSGSPGRIAHLSAAQSVNSARRDVRIAWSRARSVRRAFRPFKERKDESKESMGQICKHALASA